MLAALFSSGSASATPSGRSTPHSSLATNVRHTHHHRSHKRGASHKKKADHKEASDNATPAPSAAQYQLAFQGIQANGPGACGSPAGGECPTTPTTQYLINQDGSGLQAVNTNNPGTYDHANESVSWSPAGSTLAYFNDACASSVGTGSCQVWSETVNQDGTSYGTPQSLFAFPSTCLGLVAPPSIMAWSPDGTQIAHDSAQSGCAGPILIVSASGTGTTTTLPGSTGGILPGLVYRPIASPFTNTGGGNQTITIESPNGGNPVTYPVPNTPNSSASELSFSPDGLSCGGGIGKWGHLPIQELTQST